MRTLLVLLLVASLLGLTAESQAVPKYYTFEGPYVGYSTLGQDTPESLGVVIKSELSYTILVDTDRHGTRTAGDGTIYDYNVEHPKSGVNFNFFYADYIAGDALSGTRDDREILEYNVGHNPARGGISTTLTTGSYYAYGSSMVSMDNRNLSGQLPIDKWYVGYQVLGFNNLYFGSRWLRVDSHLTLVSIEDSYPIPEPSNILLVGFGLAALVGVCRKKFQK